jgi:hypothetical protein
MSRAPVHGPGSTRRPFRLRHGVGVGKPVESGSKHTPTSSGHKLPCVAPQKGALIFLSLPVDRASIGCENSLVDQSLVCALPPMAARVCMGSSLRFAFRLYRSKGRPHVMPKVPLW